MKTQARAIAQMLQRRVNRAPSGSESTTSLPASARRAKGRKPPGKPGKAGRKPHYEQRAVREPCGSCIPFQSFDDPLPSGISVRFPSIPSGHGLIGGYHHRVVKVPISDDESRNNNG